MSANMKRFGTWSIDPLPPDGSRHRIEILTPYSESVTEEAKACGSDLRVCVEDSIAETKLSMGYVYDVARLVSAAPDMARLLENREWEFDGRLDTCKSCGGEEHSENCEWVRVMKKAGLLTKEDKRPWEETWWFFDERHEILAENGEVIAVNSHPIRSDRGRLIAAAPDMGRMLLELWEHLLGEQCPMCLVDKAGWNDSRHLDDCEWVRVMKKVGLI